jgi:hypothetical protein
MGRLSTLSCASSIHFCPDPVMVPGRNGQRAQTQRMMCEMEQEILRVVTRTLLNELTFRYLVVPPPGLEPGWLLTDGF